MKITKDTRVFVILFSIYALWTGYLYRYFPTRQYLQAPLHLDFALAHPTHRGTMYTYPGRYQLELQLTGPESDANYALGNFMVQFSLADARNATQFTTRKPCLVPYASLWSRIIKDALLCLFQMCGYFRQEWTHVLVLADHVLLPGGDMHYAVSLSTGKLQLHGASLWAKEHKHSWVHFAAYGLMLGCYVIYNLLVLLFCAKLVWKWARAHFR